MPQPRPFVSALAAYTPGEQPRGPGVIKLNTNEFPYPAAPEVLEAIRRAADDSIRLYPSARCDELRERLAEYHGLTPQNVFVGNGSDEVLRLVIQAYGGAGRTTATVWPSYSLYPALTAMAGGRIEEFKLDGLTRIPNAAYETAWDLLLLPNPNAPLGNCFAENELDRLSGTGGLLLLDEAYIDFAKPVASVGWVREGRNVLVCRTFSKAYGLAGLRVGYALASPDIIATLGKIADSYNVNRLSQTAAIAALGARDYYMDRILQMKADRDWITRELSARGFEVAPSEANYVFARRADAKRVFETLKEKQIYVRYFDVAGLDDGMRISVGTRGQLEKLLGLIA